MTALQIRLEVIWPSFRDDLENIRKKSQRARWGYNHLYSRKFVNKLIQLEDAIDEHDAFTILFSLLKLKNDIAKAAGASLSNTSSSTASTKDEGIEIEDKEVELKEKVEEREREREKAQGDREKKHQETDKAKQVEGPGYSTITFIKCYLILNKQYSEQSYMIRLRGIIEKRVDEYQSYLGSMKPNKRKFMGLRELLCELKEEL